MKKFTLGIVAVAAIGALSVGPAAASDLTDTTPSSSAYTVAATTESSVASQAEPSAIRGLANVARAGWAGFKAGTSPREVGRMAGWGSFLASTPADDSKSFNQDEAFNR